MNIKGKMELIENMAKAGLPMAGFSNFVIEKGNDVNSDALGEQYLRVLKKYDCCGTGNRPHYLRVEVPGGNEGIVIRRFFDGLSGAQFYANRFYGVINLSLQAFDDNVDVDVLESMKEYLTINRGNLRFILSDVPQNSIQDIKKWEQVDVFVVSDQKPNVHEYVGEYLLNKNKGLSRERQEVLETLISKFPVEAWGKTMEFVLDQGDDFISAIFDDRNQEKLHQSGHIGFSV